MADLDRVKRNISRMISLNAPEADIDAYISSEGTTIDEVRAYKVQPEAAKPGVSRLESAGRGAIQGATFGFGDEIYGGVKGAYDALTSDKSLADAYAENRDAVRSANKAAQEANPGSYLAGEVAGGIAVPVGAAASGVRLGTRLGGEALTLGQRAAQGARAGAGVGAAYGLGTAEGDIPTQAIETAKGAIAGAAMGGVAAPVIDAAGAVARGVGAQFRPREAAASKVVEALERDQKGGQRLLNRLLSSAHADADTMIMDVGGKSTQRVMRAALNQQNPRTERVMLALDQRKRFEGNKIERGLREGLRLSADDFYQSIDDVGTRLRDIGEQGFRPVLAIETPMTPQLSAVLQRPTAQRLLSHVEAKLADEGRPIGFATRTEALHRIKMDLNSLIRDAQRGNASGWDVNSLRTIRRDLLEAWDNRAYREASRRYADEASLRTAAERGIDEFMTAPPQEIHRALHGMSDAERTMYRRGALQAIIERIGEGAVMNDKVRGVLGKDNMQRRLRILFGDDRRAWREFQLLQITLSRQTKARAAAQGNSTTTQQLHDAQDGARIAEGVSTAANMAAGSWGSALRDMASRGANRLAGMTPETADEVLRILTQRPAQNGLATLPGAINADRAVNSPELLNALRRAAASRERRNALLEGVTYGSAAPLSDF